MDHSRQHIPLLDGIRGYAAIIVVLFHASFLFREQVPMVSGVLAADLFFVMSGVVIERSYGDALRRGTMGIGGFLRKRLIRLYPLYLLGAVAGLPVYLVHAAGPELPITIWASAISIPTLLPQFLFGLSAYTFEYNLPAWSLSIEFYGGLAFAVIAPRLGNRGLGLMLVAGLAVLVAGVWETRSLNIGPHADDYHWGFARFWYSYTAGILIWRNYERLPALGRLGPAVLLGAMSFAFLPTHYASDLLWITLAFPLAVIAAMQIRCNAPVAAVCAHLGKISYPIYIIHRPILELALIVLARIFGPTVWVSTTGHLMALSAVAMATMVTAYWLDRPLRDAFTALLDRLVLPRTAPCRASA